MTDPTPEREPLTDEDVAVSLGELVTHAVPDRLAEIIRLLEPLDLEAAIATIEAEPLPGDPDQRRVAAMNRADRAELVRAFLALRTTGRGIVRRLEDDAAGRGRDEGLMEFVDGVL